MSAPLSQIDRILEQLPDTSIVAARLVRRALIARVYAAGDRELGDEGLILVDGAMGPWLIWEADARSLLGLTTGGGA